MSNDIDYVAWATSSLGGLATVLRLEGVSSWSELSEGISLAAEFPSDAAFRMDPKFKSDTIVADAISTGHGDALMLVSEALRATLESFTPQEMEFLPVTIFDRAGEPASTTHVIANSFHVVDALDQDAMGITWNPLDPGSIMFAQRVALDVAKLESAPPIFRPRFLTNRVLFRRDVADAIVASGATGAFFVELSEVRA